MERDCVRICTTLPTTCFFRLTSVFYMLLESFLVRKNWRMTGMYGR
jgi:hypothetical protein